MKFLPSLCIYLVFFALATMTLMGLDKFDTTTVAIYFVAALISSLSTGIIDTIFNKRKQKSQDQENKTL